MKIAVIGGDKRMLFAARAFADAGNEVGVAGFDYLMSLCEIRVMTPGEAAEWAQLIVLPVRPLQDGFLNAPFSHSPIDFRLLTEQIGQKSVFSGCAEQVRPFIRGRVFDYASREDFTYANAALTAEGALSLLLSEYEDSVRDTDMLILGWGRIGKLLSRDLSALGAHVTVAARRLSDRSLITLSGMRAPDYPDIRYEDYAVIVNTVPAPVLDGSAVDRMREDVFLIDLASAPGGVDFARARERGLTCIHALALPGKTAPLAAGRIVKDTIYTIIKEENGGKDNSGLCDDRLLLHL